MYGLFSWPRWCKVLSGTLAATVIVCLSCQGVFSVSESRAAQTQPVRRAVLPVIMYHGFLPEKGRQNTYVLDPTVLENDLREMRDRGYTAVGLQQLIDFVDEGVPLPEKAVLLTFDDGYYNNFLYAHPLLKEYGMKGVIAPIARWSAFYSDTPSEQDRPLYSHVTWEQIREMTASGVWEVANHSYDLHHAGDGGRHGTKKLKNETAEAYQAMLRADLQKAQELLTTQAGATPTAFAYPFGAISPEATAVLRELGFRITFTCEERINVLTASPDCLYGLGRYLRSPERDSAAFFDRVFGAAQAAA